MISATRRSRRVVAVDGGPIDVVEGVRVQAHDHLTTQPLAV
jgi:uncharacterized metal-binding protein